MDEASASLHSSDIRRERRLGETDSSENIAFVCIDYSESLIPVRAAAIFIAEQRTDIQNSFKNIPSDQNSFKNLPNNQNTRTSVGRRLSAEKRSIRNRIEKKEE